jgi:hypothetical protein
MNEGGSQPQGSQELRGAAQPALSAKAAKTALESKRVRSMDASFVVK